MSQHHCDSKRRNLQVRVILGFDRMLNRFFMDVIRLDAEGRARTDRPVYSSGGDPSSWGADIEFFRNKVDALHIIVPDAMFNAVQKDHLEGTGNYIVQWRSDGSSTVLLPKDETQAHSSTSVDPRTEQLACPKSGPDDPGRYGIWCTRLGGQAGFAEAWLKADGKVTTFESFEAASEEAARISQDTRSPNLRYEARELPIIFGEGRKSSSDC